MLPKILVFTPVWKRPEITRIYIAGILRLSKHKDFDIKCFCVVSPEDATENESLLKEAGIITYRHKNDPLGEKKNEGLKEALKLDFDYLLELNSDDVIKNELLDVYKPYIENKIKFLGIKNFLFYDVLTGRCKEVCREMLYGIGRLYHKSVLTIPMWKQKNRGLDNSSEETLAKKGVFATKLETDQPLAIDFKSELNIWDYESLPGREYKNGLQGLSDDEVRAIERAGKRACYA